MTRQALMLAPLVAFAAGCDRTPRPPVEPTTATAPAGATAAPAASAATAVSPGAPSRPPALTATEWRLVELQSMDDAQGTTKPDDPSRYTMRLGEDGSVAMRLNCNRATGTFAATPGPDGTSGTLEFGPLAMTRALCPPPSLDERIAAQAPYVRSYLLRDGRLALSLMADGGIIIWEPVPAGTAAGTGGAAAAALPESVATLIKTQYSSPDMASRYLSATTDLNGDGRAELLVHVVGPMACGSGGCPTLVFAPGDTGYVLVSTITVSRPPIRVSSRSRNGWRTLIVETGGGGGATGHAELAHTGKGYPGNPTVAPARRVTDLSDSEIVIDDIRIVRSGHAAAARLRRFSGRAARTMSPRRAGHAGVGKCHPAGAAVDGAFNPRVEAILVTAVADPLREVVREVLEDDARPVHALQRELAPGLAGRVRHVDERVAALA
jgi:heat shock protein HslJ